MKKVFTYQLKNTLPIIVFWFMCTIAHAQTPDLIWAKHMEGSGISRTIVADLISDNDGNVLTTGWFYGTVDFDPGSNILSYSSGTRSSIDNLFLSNMDPLGNLIWAIKIGNDSSTVRPFAMVRCQDSFIYITGQFSGTVDFDPGPQIQTLTGSASGAHRTLFVLKLTRDGKFQFVRKIETVDGAIWTNNIAVSNNQNIYIAGYFDKTVDFNPGPDSFLLTSDGINNIFILKLNSAGDFDWAKSINPGYDFWSKTLGLNCDGFENLYLTGAFKGAVNFGSASNPYILSSSGTGTGENAYILKMDSAGNVIWVKLLADADDRSRGNSLTTDIDGNIYATGYFRGTSDFDPTPGKHELTSIFGDDIFISKLDTGGNLFWVKQVQGNWFHDYGTVIKLDNYGDLLITGIFKDTADFDPGTGQFKLFAENISNYFILSLDEKGVFNWAAKIKEYSSYHSLNLLPFAHFKNYLYIAGSFHGNADVDPGPDTFNLTAGGFADAFVLKLGQPYIRRINLGPDTLLCTGDTLLLAPELKPNDKILWSTGDTTPTLTVTQSGTYHITITVDTLTFSDTIEVTFAPKPTVYIGPDTAFCGLVNYLLEPQTTNAQKFQWNTGDTTKTLHINSDGTYSLTVSSEHSCHNADTVYIDKIDYPYPLGQQDTTICGAGTHTLDAKNPGSTYQWSTGETSQTITVKESGLYSLIISNGFCSITDSVNVQFVPEEDCSKELTIYFPNAFTPYGHNPLFKAEGANVAGWSIKIFSRWGELLFTTTNFAEGWDGTYKGIACPEGVYVYIAEVRGIEGEKKVHKGNVMLMR